MGAVVSNGIINDIINDINWVHDQVPTLARTVLSTKSHATVRALPRVERVPQILAAAGTTPIPM